MLRSLLCDHIDAYVLLEGTIPVRNTTARDPNANNESIKVIFKNCAPFTDCMS